MAQCSQKSTCCDRVTYPLPEIGKRANRQTPSESGLWRASRDCLLTTLHPWFFLGRHYRLVCQQCRRKPSVIQLHRVHQRETRRLFLALNIFRRCPMTCWRPSSRFCQPHSDSRCCHACASVGSRPRIATLSAGSNLPSPSLRFWTALLSNGAASSPRPLSVCGSQHRPGLTPVRNRPKPPASAAKLAKADSHQH